MSSYGKDVIRSMQSLSHAFHCADLNPLAVYEAGEMTVNEFVAKYAPHGVRFSYEPSLSQAEAFALEESASEKEEDSVLDDFSASYQDISVLAVPQEMR